MDLPSADRLNGEGDRRFRTLILVVIVLAFVGVAFVKPWEPRNASPAPSPTPTATASPAPTQEPVTAIDWALASKVVADRDAWGLRALVLEDALSTGATPGGSPSTASAQPRTLVDRLAEVWVDAKPSDLGAPKPKPVDGTVVSDAVLVPTGGNAIAAIGVTSPNRQPVLDVRLWRIVNGSATRLDVRDLPGTDPGIDRLLIPPASLNTTGGWPAGTYQFDILVGQRVVSLTMFLPARPHNQAVINRVASIVSAMPPGLFVVRPEQSIVQGNLSVQMIPTAAVDASASAGAWLALQGGSAAGGGSSADLSADPSILAIGVHGAAGDALTSQILVSLAPVAQAAGTTSGVVVTAATGDVGIFELPSTGLAAGLFRIDTGWHTPTSWVPRSWFLDVTGPNGSSGAVSPLLDAARQWSGWAGTNTILAGGQIPVAEEPDSVAPNSDELGTSCFGAVMVRDNVKVIAIGYAGTKPESTLIQRLFTGNRTVPVAAAVAADTVPGLLLMADVQHGTWQPGFYAVSLDRGTTSASYVFCVGATQAGGGMAVPADAGSVDAYRVAVGG